MDDLDNLIEERTKINPDFPDMIVEAEKRQDMSRYQCQPWYIKLWRRRHYLRIPFMAIRIWLKKPFAKDRMEFGFYWGLSKGIVQSDMKWYYTWEEVKEHLDLKMKDD